MNMSYCAFTNTYQDLRQCLDILEEGGPTNDEEIRCAKNLIKLCAEFEQYLPDIQEKIDAAKKL